DAGANTGFSRTELLLVTRYATDPYADTAQHLELKLGLAREVSHETYLGLSDADFAADPYRRYAGSALDRMHWLRYQLALEHRLTSGPFELLTTAYHHGFHRAWRKLNRFRGGPPLADILASPEGGTREVFYRLLT